MTVAVLQLLPRQQTHGQHHRRGMAVKAWPQPALILIPAQLLFGLFMELLNGMATMGIIDQLVQRSRGGEIAPIKLAFLRLPTSRPFTQQPADVSLTLRGEAPGAHGDKGGYDLNAGPSANVS
jgi:hypothetical protein